MNLFPVNMFENRKPWLNLGCGSRFREEWINIDMMERPPHVLGYDLRKGIPLSSDSCDIVYHSSFIEHLRVPEALDLMIECFRVLKLGGIVRVATPDLERICRLYLEKLDSACKEERSVPDYDWIMLELYDQEVRESSGGRMLEYLKQDSLPNEKFILERIGIEGVDILRSIRDARNDRQEQRSGQVGDNAGSFVMSLKQKLKWRILEFLIGHEGLKAKEIGEFRLGGEVHHWMYDRFSLKKLFVRAGFSNIVLQTAATSNIRNWQETCLDSLPDGAVLKPDSLFMEGVKNNNNE